MTHRTPKGFLRRFILPACALAAAAFGQESAEPQPSGPARPAETGPVLETVERAAQKITEGALADALSLFDEALRQAPDTDTAADVQLQRAAALLKANRFESALSAFQAVLDVAKDPAVKSRALAGKGWSLWEQSRFEESALAFEGAAAEATDTEPILLARLKAGDARLAAGQYAQALDNYSFTAGDPGGPLYSRATYQIGVTHMLAGRKEEARTFFKQTETEPPGNAFAAQAALQNAGLLKDEQRWTEALEEYRRIFSRYAEPGVQAAALLQQGLILYRLERREEALQAFRSITERHPGTPEAEQAFFMEGFCLYLEGHIDEAVAVCRKFTEQYPESDWTPEVLFWLAEHHYNHGNYLPAAESFLDIADRFPAHELADDALFRAGNARLQQQLFLEALSLYSRLARDYSSSSLLPNTRFAQGNALTELGEFSRAILAFEEVIRLRPDDPLADRARGRLADCLFTLGAETPARYAEALSAYTALHERPAVFFSLKLQALYKAGRCHIKSGNPERALELYLEAAERAAAQTDPLPPDALHWFSRAALDAALIKEKQENQQEAEALYRKIIEKKAPGGEEAERRLREGKSD